MLLMNGRPGLLRHLQAQGDLVYLGRGAMIDKLGGKYRCGTGVVRCMRQTNGCVMLNWCPINKKYPLEVLLPAWINRYGSQGSGDNTRPRDYRNTHAQGLLKK